jgi:hypothetical protein
VGAAVADGAAVDGEGEGVDGDAARVVPGADGAGALAVDVDA